MPIERYWQANLIEPQSATAWQNNHPDVFPLFVFPEHFRDLIGKYQDISAFRMPVEHLFRHIGGIALNPGEMKVK